ncbi:unnamed protein product [Kluyveromyces dobzhanskii CBS 2104]|uniref:Increased recombination centers protein 22 n=1 Tax=Kluyveromyces dobzhanskii CBS 2104 TaxID=1427455 RepID=A0A0A8L4B1_9SACH|nr:unnamed protein product [Kluyveromyces dobzhanskii CBS 2104]
MRFSTIALFFSALTSVYVNSEEVIEFRDKVPLKVGKDSPIELESQPAQQEPKNANFLIQYDVLEQDYKTSSGVIEVENGKTITLSYNFTNLEDADVNLFAFGGSILEMATGQEIASISRTDFSPIYVGINDSSLLQQQLPIDLPEGMFYVVPHIYVEKEGEQMKVGTSPSYLQVIPPPMSLFNPQFLSIQLFLLGLVAAVSYYMFGLSPSAFKKPVKKQAKASISNEWLPQNHIK